MLLLLLLLYLRKQHLTTSRHIRNVTSHRNITVSHPRRAAELIPTAGCIFLSHAVLNETRGVFSWPLFTLCLREQIEKKKKKLRPKIYERKKKGPAYLSEILLLLSVLVAPLPMVFR